MTANITRTMQEEKENAIRQGKIEGKIEGKLEFAKNLLEQGIAVEVIVKAVPIAFCEEKRGKILIEYS